MRTRTLITAGVLAGVATIAIANPAEAGRPRPKIDVTSTTATFDSVGGSAVVSGAAEGRPFGGSFAAELAAVDGTLPDPGVCEPASVTFHLDGPDTKHIDAVASGNVCGQWVQPPYIATQVFTGRYEVVDARGSKFVGTDGFLEVRLGNDGSASTFLIDT